MYDLKKNIINKKRVALTYGPPLNREPVSQNTNWYSKKILNLGNFRYTSRYYSSFSPLQLQPLSTEHFPFYFFNQQGNYKWRF